MARCCCLIMLLLFSRPAAAGEDMASLPSALFDAARAPAPVPGQWIEYHVGFPADPLESSLLPGTDEAQKSGRLGETVDLGDGNVYHKPTFEPEVVWRVLPLRLEIRAVKEDGCDIVLTFEGVSHEVFLPKGEEDPVDWRYKPVAEGTDRRFFVKMGGKEYEVEAMRRENERYGFVRYFCPEVPFGVYRFATADVDVVMVAFGSGQPPVFPLETPTPVDPPVGRLYATDGLQ